MSDQQNDTQPQQAAPAEQVVTVPPEVRAQIGEAMAKVMEQMPFLTGALDRAMTDLVGSRVAFAIVVFGKGFALHGANIPKEMSDSAIVSYAEALKNGGSNAAG
jgi:hypothetical protein